MDPTVPPTAPAPSEPRPRGIDRGALVGGIVLVALGLGFLAVQVVDVEVETWPLFIIIPGVALFLASFAVGGREGLGLAIPGAIVAAVGAVLWVQETYDLYETWAYAWALVAPGAVGLAMLVYGLFRGDGELAGNGVRTLLVGIGLFLGFALFFEGVIGLSGDRFADLDTVLPIAVIGLGALLVVLSFFGGRARARG